MRLLLQATLSRSRSAFRSTPSESLPIPAKPASVLTASAPPGLDTMMKFADIAVNLADPMFEGSYHGKQKHDSDLEAVVQRAKARGVDRMLITGTSLEDSREALALAERFDLHCTVGIHPTSTSTIPAEPSAADRHFSSLESLLTEDAQRPRHQRRVRALGEIGLDYDRLKFAPKDVQLEHLPRLLELGRKHGLPFFLHSRTPGSHEDLVKALLRAGWPKDGIVGPEKAWIKLGLYIGINGCSLKTEDNLTVLKTIPLDRLMIETDAPWCSITTSHASHRHLPPATTPDLFIPRVNKAERFVTGQGVKGRQEPADVAVIAHIVAAVRGEAVENVANAAWHNSCRLFWPDALD